MVPLVLAIASGPLLLLIWSLAYSADCWVLLLPLIVIVITTLAARDSIRHRRRCLADCYFVHESLLHRLLRSTTLITTSSVIVSALLTTVLLISVPGWSVNIMILLALDSLFIAMLYLGLTAAAEGRLSVSEGYRSVFARHWAVTLNIPVVVAGLVLLQLREPPPEYIDPALNAAATMQSASAELASNCRIIDVLTRSNQEAEAFAWWLMIKSSSMIENSHLRWLAWLFFLLSGTFGLLAYSRFCAQMVYYADEYGSR